jgi:transposase
VICSSSQTWAELHERAFRRLGGVTRVVVLDNLRESVLAPDIYDPTPNPLLRHEVGIGPRYTLKLLVVSVLPDFSDSLRA